MENFTFNFFNANLKRHVMTLLLLCCMNIAFAQTTVPYTLGNTSYYTVKTQGTSGTFLPNGTAELGMYSNGGAPKNVVAYRDFKTAGDNTGSVRALQVGDVFSLQVWASAAAGQFGFSLNTTNVTTNYSSRITNSRLFCEANGTTGSWVAYHDLGGIWGVETLNYNLISTYSNYQFKVYITSDRTCDIEFIVDGVITRKLFNRLLAGPAGTNITGFSLYLSDDNNGSANSNVYWKQVTEVRSNTLVNLGYYLDSGNFTPGIISNGLTANSTSTTSVNALNIGGDAGTTVILNQSNTYTGATIVNPNARGELQHAQALGTTPYIDVFNNGAVSLYSPTGITFNNYLTVLSGNGQNGANGAMRNVGGNNIWPGNFQMGASARINADISVPAAITMTIGGTQPVTINGNVFGTTLAKDGTNTLTLNSLFNGFNTVNIYDGIVSVANAGSIGVGTIGFPVSATTGTLAVTNSISITGPASVQSTKATIDVANGQAATFTGMFYGTGRLTKSGSGMMNMFTSSTPMSGGLNIANGILSVNNGGQLGGGTLNLGLNASDVSQANNVALQVTASTTISQPVIVAANTSGATRTVQAFLGNMMNLTSTIILNGTLSTFGNGQFNMSNVVSGAGGLTLNGGSTTLSGANTYLGNTTVNAGAILILGNSNTMPNASNINLNGGSLNSGGFSDQMNKLRVDANSSISLANGSHALTFANSSLEPWAGTLTIYGWNGLAGQSNAFGGRIMVGVGGLSAAQLALVTFDGRPGTPIILSSGELVPPGPILTVTAGATSHGSVCVGSPATTITYTITNTGGDAAGVDVGTNSEEFAVSNLSTTTIVSGGTATYSVTFTPAIGGERNAVITIVTPTQNSNTPLQSSVTGTGIAPTAYYADADVDSFGDADAAATLSCTAIAGLVTNNSDCDDNNDAIHPNAIEVCDGVDNDCDGLTDGADPGLDLSSATAYYPDADVDGYGDASASPIMACSVPIGSVANNGDCNDSNGAVHPNASEVCDGIDNDCNGLTDGEDPGIDSLSTTAYYPDTDLDGYGDSNASATMTCSAPAGFVANNTDCNDSKISVHPNANEIPYNLIDDDCDNLIDEGFPPKVTVIQGSQCTSTLTKIDSYIYANLVAGAQGYHWRITTIEGPNVNQVQTVTTALRNLRLTQLENYAFNARYKVEVGVVYGGYPQPFGNSNCIVTTPATQTQLVSCSTVLTSMSNVIYANAVPFAQGYKFRITDPLNPTKTQTLYRVLREFRMNLITDFQVFYGKTYNVEVAIKNTDGTYLDFQSVCEVTTPLFPTTQIQASQCDNGEEGGEYPVPALNTSIYADSYPGAIRYNFRVYGGDLAVPRKVEKALRVFTLNDFPGLTPGVTYTVDVRMVFNTTEPVSDNNYGKSCTFKVPGGPVIIGKIAAPEFKAAAYPNPFAENLRIEITTAAIEKISVRVYDMTGRLLDSRTAEVADVKSLDVGDKYPSGVYNVIVQQGDNVKALRVIKR
jgi:autotransporter-associated beta strand protein